MEQKVNVLYTANQQSRPPIRKPTDQAPIIQIMLALGTNATYNNIIHSISRTQRFWNQNGQLPLLALSTHAPQGLR